MYLLSIHKHIYCNKLNQVRIILKSILRIAKQHIKAKLKWIKVVVEWIKREAKVSY